MARIGEFCSSNITRFLLMIFIGLALVVAVGAWFFYSPGRPPSIVKPTQQAVPNK